jgi:hypothetical protein
MSSRRCWAERLLSGYGKTSFRRNTFAAPTCTPGEFHGSELVMMAFLSSYQDPTFGEAHREMVRVAPEAIIEWLKRRGNFQMPAPKNRRTFRRWLRDNIFLTWGVIFGFGLAIGWLLRMLWNA